MPPLVPHRLIQNTGTPGPSTHVRHYSVRTVVCLMTAILILAAVGSPASCAVRWSWQAGRPQGWDTVATASGTRLESPMFTVTGDSIGVRFNGTVPNDISVALLTLDGAVQFESVAAAGSNAPEIAWDVSSMRGTAAKCTTASNFGAPVPGSISSNPA